MGRLLDEDAVVKEIKEWQKAFRANCHRESVSDVNLILDAIKNLPSAQPEIVRCGECKHRDPEDKKCDCGHDIIWQLPRDDDWFCADAERRTE